MGRDSGAHDHVAPHRVRILRKARSIHARVALPLMLLVVVSSLTGIVLGWKKNVDTLQPPTQASEAVALSAWLPLHQLAAVATAALAAHAAHGATGDAGRLVPDRLDVQPGKGIVKVLFPGDWEVQVEGSTALVRSVARRHADWIERLHDGSIVSDGFKLVAMTALGFGLLVLATSGFWMWYGPKRLRRIRLREKRMEASQRAA